MARCSPFQVAQAFTPGFRALAKLRARRPAFTLMEVLLAVTIVVALGAIAWPALRGPLALARLRGGAQQVQSTFGKARLLAMSSGDTAVVKYVIGGNEYRLQPLSADYPMLASEDSLLDPQLAQLNSEQWKLPQDVVFANQEIMSDERSQTNSMLIEQRQSISAAAPESLIFFYPDGTSSTARVLLMNQDQRQITVELRGLTGMARVLDVEVVQ